MEYPMILYENKNLYDVSVLILVLMEYPMIESVDSLSTGVKCLNPCSNGIPYDL